MGRYLSRFLQLIASLFVLLVLCFGLLRFFPGSPFVDESSLDPAVVANLKETYGLNQPISIQFFKYLSQILKGDFGVSMHFPGRTVQSLLWEFGQTSVLLGGIAFLISIGFAISFALLTRRRNFRYLAQARFILLVLISIPTLALAPFLVWLLSIRWELLPVALLNQPSSYILPVALLALKPAVGLSRVLGESLDEVLATRYILVSRSLGFSDWKILSKWAFKNSLNSFISQAGPMLAGLISGSFLIEILFGIPGLGFHFVEGVLSRDWSLILGMTLLFGTTMLVIHWISDILLEKVNPQ